MSHDPTFVAHLDTRNNEFSAPLSVVAELPIIKGLTSDMEFLKKAIRKSPNLVFDEEKSVCKPTFKLVQRTTLILRDIPVATPEHEVRALFALDPEVSVGILDTRPEVGDNYFVTFGTEEMTVRAFNLVRTVTFNGKVVQARIKSESLLKNSYYVDPAVLQLQQQQQQQQQEILYHDPYAGSYGRGRGGRYNNNNRRGRGGVGGKDFNPVRKQPGSNGVNRHNNKRGGAAVGKEGNVKTQNVPLNGTSHWPPLHDKGHSSSGYSGSFQRYSRQQVVAIFTTSISTTTAESAPPQWLIPTTQLPIFSDQPFTQLEVMRPVKETKVEFNESKKRKGHGEKKGEAESKAEPHTSQPQHPHPHPHQQKHQQQPKQPQPQPQQDTPQSKAYAEAAKSASLNSTG